jgi:Cd2+/Zn2+-exporting ATPase
MNLLMVVAIIGAMILGGWFEGAMVSFLFALSLLLEQWSVERSRRATGSLLEMAPKTARVRNSRSGQVREVIVEDIAVGATVIVRPGDKIPLDGIVLSGNTTVSQAPITGESMPIEKMWTTEFMPARLTRMERMDLSSTDNSGHRLSLCAGHIDACRYRFGADHLGQKRCAYDRRSIY